MRTAKAAAGFLVYCQYRDLRPKTMEFYRWTLRHLESHWEDLPTDSRQLLPVVGNRRLARESRRDIRRGLVRFFWWAAREYSVPNPTLELEPLPRTKILPRVLTPDEVKTLWASCMTDRERGMVGVILDSGVRLGEVAGLVKGDLGPGYMRVSGKTGERQVPLSPSVQQLLERLGDSQHIWMGRWGPMTQNGIQKTYRDLFKRSGLTGRKLGPHLLRHTFGTIYCRKGGNIRILQEIMGHRDITTTMIYVHLAGRDVAVDHALFSPITTLELVT